MKISELQKHHCTICHQQFPCGFDEHWKEYRERESITDQQPTTMEPSQSDTLRERHYTTPDLRMYRLVITDDDGKKHVGYMSQQDESILSQDINSLIAQEKERWENELREKIENNITCPNIDMWEGFNYAKLSLLALISKRKE